MAIAANAPAPGMSSRTRAAISAAADTLTLTTGDPRKHHVLNNLTGRRKLLPVLNLNVKKIVHFVISVYKG
jgi:hypothetical protein